MAELVPVPADVQVITGVIDRSKLSGEAILAGDVVYLKAGDGKWWKAFNTSTEAVALVEGIAVSSAPGPDQPIPVALPASANNATIQCIIDLGVTLVIGLTYYLASTAGKVELEGDVATGAIERKTACLFAKDADQAIFQPVATGALKP